MSIDDFDSATAIGISEPVSSELGQEHPLGKVRCATITLGTPRRKHALASAGSRHYALSCRSMMEFFHCRLARPEMRHLFVRAGNPRFVDFGEKIGCTGRPRLARP
jgi:hypothetical protein